jgi:hypothetical protein
MGGLGLLGWYSDSLWDGRFGDRILAVARFPATVQTSPALKPTQPLAQWVQGNSRRQSGRGEGG